MPPGVFCFLFCKITAIPVTAWIHGPSPHPRPYPHALRVSLLQTLQSWPSELLNEVFSTCEGLILLTCKDLETPWRHFSGLVCKGVSREAQLRLEIPLWIWEATSICWEVRFMGWVPRVHKKAKANSTSNHLFLPPNSRCNVTSCFMLPLYCLPHHNRLYPQLRTVINLLFIKLFLSSTLQQQRKKVPNTYSIFLFQEMDGVLASRPTARLL